MSDKSLRNDVIAALDWEPSIDATDIAVTTERGLVHLSGHVPNNWQRLTAERIAKGVKGVKGLITSIEIRQAIPDEPDDEQIALRAISSLGWNVVVPKDSILVEVKNGFVTLSGEVDWHFQREAAEQAVLGLEGVGAVINVIQIRQRPMAADLKVRIEDALKRDAEVEAQNIQVDVDQGRVTLRGTVSDWREREAIESAVWAAPGVIMVDDRVVIA